MRSSRAKKSSPYLTRPFTSDKFLRKLMKKEISREGKYTTVSDNDITTERFLRPEGETILTLEKGELRTEVEKANSGKVLTRTWQDGKLTTFTVSGTKRTTMVLLDEKGNFVHKIITEKDSSEPYCFRYKKKRQFRIKNSECMGLIPGF